MDDALLVGEFQRTGDDAAFAALVERHRRSVFRLILSILGAGHRGEAEELAQEVFLKVYRKLDQFRGEAKFSSWLYRIAYNHAVGYRSRASFKARRQGEEALETEVSIDPRDDPHGRALRSRAAEALEECIATLPDVYRSVLNLYYWLGMTVPEISVALSAPEGTVKSYMHRARIRLHKQLVEKGVTDV